jgi:SAM-dependent methyltransferase
MPNLNDLLSKFPKQRIPLCVEQQAIYEKEYLLNRDGQTFITSLAQKLESWMHRQVAKYVVGSHFLELGAGTLNQVPYMQDIPITRYDVVEPAQFFFEHSKYKKNIHHFYNDISECDHKYDSIFSVAALEHVTSLPLLLAKATLLLAEGGRVISAIPCEGGLLWGAGWRLSTGLAYKLRTGFSYANIMRYEHVNNYNEIVSLHKHFFNDVHIVYFPLSHKHLAFYACIIAQNPKIDVSHSFCRAA